MSDLQYDPETGELTRNGRPAGCMTKAGYIQVYVDGKRTYAHRVAWRIFYGVWPARDLDHIDGDRAHNSIANLREATMSQNIANSKRHSNNRSGYKGVFWDAQLGRWRARIMHHRKGMHLGCFDDPAEAHKAYAAKAKELFGDFARVG